MSIRSNLRVLACVAAFALAGPALAIYSSADASEQVETTYPAPSRHHLEHQRPSRILFIGNSYFYYNDSLHNHVERMAVAAGLFASDDLTFKSETIGGAALRDHAIDHLLKPENLRVKDKFEVVIMQGISSAALSANGRKRFSDAAQSFAKKIRKTGGQPVLFMTPAYVAPNRRQSPEMISQIASLYIETGNEIDALVIPVGLAFEEAYRRRPDIQLHKHFDGSHPSLLGTYLATATVFASLYETSPVGNRYDYYGAVDQEDARFLQEVAQDTVQKFFRR